MRRFRQFTALFSRRASYILLTIGVAGLLGACRPQYYTVECAPPPLPGPRVVKTPVRVALVLGGGGARGMAHVGVLEELERAGVPVDLIVGCSAGSLVGALYADDPSASKLRDHLMHLKRRDFFDFQWLTARFGLSTGRQLRKRMHREMSGHHFEDLQIPLLVVATDLREGELVTLGTGPVAPAVEASCAVPVAFRPVEYKGRMLVDGGVVDPTPVEVARSQNPEVVIAVDLTQMLPNTSPSNLFGVAKRCAEIHYLRSSQAKSRNADILIRPCLDDVGIFDESQTERIYHAGREAARKMLPEILERLGLPTTGSIASAEEEPQLQEV